MDPLTVVVYGPVGVGKSTAVDALDDGDRDVFCVREPVDAMLASGALDDVYSNRSSSGLRLQMLVVAHRLASYWAVASRMANAHLPPAARPLVVCDGHMSLDPSIFVDEHVRNGRMSASDHAFYASAIAVMQAQAPVFAQRPALYVYLRGTPDACRRRAEQRARAAERSLDLAFFERMVAACERVTKRLAAEVSVDQQLIVIDTSALDRDAVADALRNALRVALTTAVPQ